MKSLFVTTLVVLSVALVGCGKKEPEAKNDKQPTAEKVKPEAAPTTVAAEPAKPGGAEAPPTEAKPAEAKPAEAKTAEASTAEAQPVDAKPAEYKPAEAKPVEAKPVEAKPVEAKPVEAKPVEAKTAEAKPVEEGQPVEVKPAEDPAKPAEVVAQGLPAEQALPEEPTDKAPEAKENDPFAPPADVAAPPADAAKTASGLASKVITAGTGSEKPAAADTVKVHYTGWTTDGKMFDSSKKRGEPTSFPLNRVIPGWTEGVGLMVVGETRRLWIPEALAYKGRPGAPQGMLVFDVELLEIKKAPEPPKAPEDVAAPPADAEKTESGLSSKVLKKGTGAVKPKATDQVKVHYTGWTTDGKMFDSSVMRGEPATFPLNRVIPGWTEGVALMVEGEQRRLWIPQELAYKGRPGPPAGMLVFDVELIEIVK